MNYCIFEIQGNEAGGVACTPTVVKTTREEADNAFFTASAAAALSGLPFHAVVCVDELGFMVQRQAYDRRIPEPTPEPDV